MKAQYQAVVYLKCDKVGGYGPFRPHRAPPGRFFHPVLISK